MGYYGNKKVLMALLKGDQGERGEKGEKGEKGDNEIVECTYNKLLMLDKTQTVSGVQITSTAQNKVTIKGTGTSNGGRYNKFSQDILLSAGVYYMSINGGCKADCCVQKTDGGTVVRTNIGSFTLEEDTSVFIGFNVISGVEYDETVYIQISEGERERTFLPPNSAVDFVARSEITPLKYSVKSIKATAFNEIKQELGFIVGDIQNSTKPYGTINSNVRYRIATEYIQMLDCDLRVKLADGIKGLYWYYDSVNSEGANSKNSYFGWYTGSFTVPANTPFRIVVTPVNNTDNTAINDIQNSIQYAGLTIQPLDTSEEIDIPNYWLSHLIEKENAINTIGANIGSSGTAFVFLTDVHITTNFGNSLALIKHIQEHTSVDTLICGGDITDGGNLTREQCVASIRAWHNEAKKLNLFMVRGNHDCEPTANVTVNQIPDGEYYNLFVRPIEKSVDTCKSLYYKIDNVSQKVRYIVMDSGGMNNALDTTQLNWLKNCLTELDSEWTAVVFQHMVAEQNSDTQTVNVSTRGNLTCNAINEVYDTLQCKFAGIVCGHCHVDYVITSSKGYPIIFTTTDSGGANAVYDWNYPTRNAETTTEQAFDVMQIDTANRKIYCTRIGVGEDREISY